MLLGLQLAGVAEVPLKVTVLAPCVAPNPTPVMVIGVPATPEIADRLLINGAVDGLVAGRISTALKLYGSLVGAVSEIVTAEPPWATAVSSCWTQNVSPGVGQVKGKAAVQGCTS
jgi:hypothetical protein